MKKKNKPLKFKKTSQKLKKILRRMLKKKKQKRSLNNLQSKKILKILPKRMTKKEEELIKRETITIIIIIIIKIGIMGRMGSMKIKRNMKTNITKKKGLIKIENDSINKSVLKKEIVIHH